MAHSFQAGDSVAVIARDATNSDTKSGLYYPHFADMRGTVLKIYGEEASILIDRDSLHTEIRVRHEENEIAERKKYAERISEAARNSLSDKEKNFPLQYTILIALKDVVPDADGAARRLSATDLDNAEATFLAERTAKKKK